MEGNMKKILVLIKENNIVFSTYTRQVPEENLNNTNVINVFKAF